MNTEVKWNNLPEFARWYVANNFPIRPPYDGPVYFTSISYSYVLYREGQYQAELYLIKPNAVAAEHSHPGVENIIMQLGGIINGTVNGWPLGDTTKASMQYNPDGTSLMFKIMGQVLTDKDVHSLTTGVTGGAVISFEKWPDGIKPYSLSENWEGPPIDSEHNIKKIETQKS